MAPFWELLKDDTVEPAQKLGGLQEMDRILGRGVASMEPQQLDPGLEAEVQALIEQREKARRDKDYSRADEIRDRLRQMEVIVEDTPSGPRWKKEKL
jgi:cysteinyl-tRNA synthetase